MSDTVSIACRHERLEVGRADAVVAVDVIRATTTATTAVASGRRCHPVASIGAAVALADVLPDALLAGELGGYRPYGFDLQNSPTELLARTDGPRPVVLLSTSGTALMCEAAGVRLTYVACLRNVSATVRAVAGRHHHVLIAGADSRGEFREEDQLCCVRIAAGLLAQGYELADKPTERLHARWSHAPDEAFLSGRSVSYLKGTEQLHDLRFVLEHIDDYDSALVMDAGEIRTVTP